jgi:hypothetical protein
MFWRDEASRRFSTSAPRRVHGVTFVSSPPTQLLTQDAATTVEPMGLLLSATGNLHSTPQTLTL